jgi:ADP-ribose pyrophosphatase YjhB (NUDIX family)
VRPRDSNSFRSCCCPAGSLRPVLPYEQYAASLNRKRIGSGVLFHDTDNRVLLVETSYKPQWEIPGGAVEAGETPWSAAPREVLEELGVDRPIGRLLVVDHIPEEDVMPEGLAFIFDGGLMTDEQVANLRFADGEIVSAGLFHLEEMRPKMRPRLAGRVAAALDVLRNGGVALCESGKRIS